MKMTTEHQSTVTKLEERLRKIEILETEVAPKGVNFALRGQEDVSSKNPCIGTLRDPVAAADAVIGALNHAKELISQKDKLAAQAVTL